MKIILIILTILSSMLVGWFSHHYFGDELSKSIDKNISSSMSFESIDKHEHHDNEQQTRLDVEENHAIKHLDPNYVCPMHPQIVKGEPGSCPICGMDLVELEIETEVEQESNDLAKKHDGLSHAKKHLDPNYVCPMHPQIVKGEAGSCPICGMDLVEVEIEISDEVKVSATKLNSNNVSSKEKDVLYWVAPMDANYRRDEPGKSPMGMDLVPVYVDGDKVSKNKKSIKVNIDPAIVNHLGVVIEKAKKSTLSRQLETVAYVEYNEDNLSHVHQLSDGWIENLVVKNIGKQVNKGDLLYEIYSPELTNAQDDYLLSLNNKFKRVQKASKQRLYTLGFSAKQIANLKKTRKIKRTLKVYSHHKGIVTKLTVREGMYVKPQTEIMTLADLSSVWLMAEIYEKQANWVKVGDDVIISFKAFPGKTWQSTVDYVYPELDKLSRTIKVRIPIDNLAQQFKLNMYANVKIETDKKENVLTIPSQAIIRSGTENRVIVQTKPGSFMPKDINLGMESGDKSEVLSGLEEGDKVIISGQFLIDSEASLKASLLRFLAK